VYYRGRKRRGYSSRSAGHERARQHIREAHQLSEELGGSDNDVKAYFFSLGAQDLKDVLDEYEKKYGRVPRQYAEITIPFWKNGRRQMSGQTASRLFKLLPDRMPLAQKYSLVETLWEKYSPRSEYSVTFGPLCDASSIRDTVASHLDSIVKAYTVPDALQKRFEWLSSGGSLCFQQLLNHFLMKDRELALEAVNAQVQVVLKEVKFVDHQIRHFKREAMIGGHRVHVLLDPNATSVTLLPGAIRILPKDGQSSGWLIAAVIAIIAVVLWAMNQ
jgi:hypothetical protein